MVTLWGIIFLNHLPIRKKTIENENIMLEEEEVSILTLTDGKGGIHYSKRSGVALETQFAPDSVHHPEWPQPFVKAGEKYHSETVYRFSI